MLGRIGAHRAGLGRQLVERAAAQLANEVLAGLGVNSLSMTPVALDDVRASLAEVTFEEAQARAEAALNGDFYHPAN